MDKFLLIVLANQMYKHRLSFNVCTKDEYKAKYVNEERFNTVAGLEGVEAITFVGDVKPENADKFKTLIKE